MKKTIAKTLAMFLSVFLLLTGCVSTDTSKLSGKSNKKIVYVTEDDEIIHHINGESTDNMDSQDNSSNQGLYEEEEIKPISSGTWKQERFYLGSCTGPSSYEGLKVFKEAGFNLCQWAMQGDSTYFTALANCNQVGGIYALPCNEFRTASAGGDTSLVFNEKLVAKTVEKYASVDPNRLLMGYTVWDEPYLIDDFYTKANLMVKYLNKYDPNSLKFFNLLPSYGIYTWNSSDKAEAFGAATYEEYVENFIKGINPQVLSLDYYPYLMGTAGDTGDWFRDMGVFRKMSLKYNIPFWFYYQIVEIKERGARPTNDQIRYQMYVGLAYGAKTLIGWNCDAVTSNNEKNDTFDDTKARNAEIMTVGTYLLDKTTTSIYHTGAAGHYTDKFYLDKLEDSTLIASAPERMILSVFEDGSTSTKYLLAVNKNTQNSVTGTIALKGNYQIGIFNKSTSKSDNIGLGNSINININAGGAEIYILK